MHRMGHRGGTLMGEVVSMGTMRRAGRARMRRPSATWLGLIERVMKGVLVRTRWTNCAVIEAINNIYMESRPFALLG